MWRDPASERLVVLARMRGNTDGAWAEERARVQAFHDGVEAGVKKRVQNYRRLERRGRTLGARKVPALDLWYRTGAGKARRVVGVRFLFFRTIGFFLVVESPGSRVDRDTRKLLESFGPG